jgi:hypothetical protein
MLLVNKTQVDQPSKHKTALSYFLKKRNNLQLVFEPHRVIRKQRQQTVETIASLVAVPQTPKASRLPTLLLHSLKIEYPKPLAVHT